MDDIKFNNQHYLFVIISGRISSEDLKAKISAVKELTGQECIVTVKGKYRNDKGDFIFISTPHQITNIEIPWVIAKDAFGIQRFIDPNSAESEWCQIKIKTNI